jgi:hypothetical protein
MRLQRTRAVVCYSCVTVWARHEAAEPRSVGRLELDFLALLFALFEIGGSTPGGRVTVKDRYEMKKKVRALQQRERKAAEKKRVTGK